MANPSSSEALAVLPDNPLPDAIVVTLRDTPDLARHASKLAQEWRSLPQVDSVQLDSDWVRRLEAILGFIRIGLGMLRSEEHTSELQSLMRISYAVFCLKKKKQTKKKQ